MSGTPHRDAGSRAPLGNAPANDGVVVPARGGARRAVTELPTALRPAFSHFQYFNAVQAEMLDQVLNTSSSFVVSAPDGSGKTTLLELALVRVVMETPRVMSCAGACWGAVVSGGKRRKALYISPSAVSETHESWRNRFGALGVTCETLPSFFFDRNANWPDFDEDDTETCQARGAFEGEGTSYPYLDQPTQKKLQRADVFLATPATFYALTKAATRCDGNEALFLNQILHDIRLVMLDDAHLMDDCFEAAVALLKMMDGTVPRFAVCASSVDFASVTALGRWLDFLPRVDATQTAGPNANVTSTTPGWNVACASMPTLVKRFGNEHRAVPVAVEVVGFEIPWAKTEFAFDKALDEKIAGVVTSKRFAKKPVVVLCASRDGASRTAEVLATHASEIHSKGQNHPYIVDDRHRATLDNASKRVADATLRRCLAQGVGIVSSKTSKFDREFVAALFENETLQVVCGVYTAGVPTKNGDTAPPLPPHIAAPLCVVKGTRKYVGNSAFVEMDSNDVSRAFAACGRVGVDDAAKAVIMTRRDTCGSYRKHLQGGDSVESQLKEYKPEYLNDAIVCGAVASNAEAVRWWESTFASFSGAQRSFGADTNRFARAALTELNRQGMFEYAPDRETIVPTGFAKVMEHTHTSLSTMTCLTQRPFPVTVAETLTKLTSLTDEFVGVQLRNDEKKTLRLSNANRNAVRFPLTQSGTQKTPKPVLATAIRTSCEKLFVLAQLALSDFGHETTNAPDKTKQDAERFLQRAPSLARGAFAIYSRATRNDGTFAACFASLRVAKSLSFRIWDDTPFPARQFGVSPVVCEKLATAGVKSLDDILGATPRELELKAGLASPFGERLLADVASLPPAMALRIISVLDVTNQNEPDGAFAVRVVVERAGPAVSQNAFAETQQPTTQTLAPTTTWCANLLIGCLWKDTLVFATRVERTNATDDDDFARVVQIPKQCAPSVPGEETVIVAALVFANCLGRDVHADVTYVVPAVLPVSVLASTQRGVDAASSRLAAERRPVASPPPARTPPPTQRPPRATTPLTAVRDVHRDLALDDETDSLFSDSLSPRPSDVKPALKRKRVEKTTFGGSQLSCES